MALFALLLGCWLGCVDDWPRLFDLVWFSENLKEKKTKSEKLFSRFRNVYTFASRENRQFSRSARFARFAFRKDYFPALYIFFYILVIGEIQRVADDWLPKATTENIF